nr:MAG TPA: helix-turn-helix, Psq domain [Caudoviricetes sp.]
MGAPEHVEQLQASVRALSAMGLTYADISEIEGISRDTVNTWGKGTSRAHGALPVTKVGRTARVIHRLVVTLADIGRSHARGGAARVTVRRGARTPDWALRLTLAAAQGWLVREALMPPADGESYQCLPPAPTIEARPGATYPDSSIAYKRSRGVWPVGADFKMPPQLRFPSGYRHVVVDVPNLLLWSRFSEGLPPGDYPWRPDTTGE